MFKWWHDGYGYFSVDLSSFACAVLVEQIVLDGNLGRMHPPPLSGPHACDMTLPGLRQPCPHP
jgi:hypothetical protein